MTSVNFSNQLGHIISKTIISVLTIFTFLIFYGRLQPAILTDQTTPISDFEVIESQVAVFFTNVMAQDLTQTQIEFSYTFDTPHQELWLSLQTKPAATPIIILVSHPTLANLNWPKVQSPQFTLYQKDNSYATINSFLEQIPSSARIVADPSLIYRDAIFTHPEQTVALSTNTDLANTDYLLTTYHEPAPNGKVYTFSALVDASDGQIIECSPDRPLDCHPQLMWKLDMPTVSSSNKFYLDDIKINYRQDDSKTIHTPISPI